MFLRYKGPLSSPPPKQEEEIEAALPPLLSSPLLSPHWGFLPASLPMFAHLQQNQQRHQKQQLPMAQSMAQSLADLSALPAAMFGVDALQANQANPNLSGNFDHFNELGMNAIYGQVGGGGGENWRDQSKPRKRWREEDQKEDEMVASTSCNFNLLAGRHQRILSAPSGNPQNRPATLHPPLCCPGDPDSDLLLSMEKDLLELDLFISAQVERAMTEMEQRWRRRLAGVVRAVEEGVRQVLRAKDEEIASLARRNSALEESISVLSLEGQMWRALARTSEDAATALRREVVLAQQAAAAAGGRGSPRDRANFSGEVVDSVSYCVERRGEDLEEEGEGECGGSPGRRCQMCGRGGVSTLVLPCRHLCLCSGCDSGAESCPMCGCQKTASIKVYLC